MVITFSRIKHRGHSCVLVSFPYNKDLKNHIQLFPGVLWSKTFSGFYLRESSENQIAELIAHMDQPGHSISNKLETFRVEPRPLLSKEKKPAFDAYVSYLTGLRLSESTIHVYSGFIKDFLLFAGVKRLESINNEDVRLFVEHIVPRRRYSISSHRQIISALKHFAFFYPDCSIDADTLVRPTKSRILPTVLSQEEVVDLLRHTKNIKHRAVLGLIYSSGLRIGELLKLELRDIFIDRKQVFIRSSKGRKDRYVVLSAGLMPLLHNYMVSYQPKKYFVESPNGGPYCASSVRKFIKVAAKNARIAKNITPHTLRHSYATHLLENGIGVRHIQELLGHAKPETTMIYTHVAKKDLMDIRSPLDNILIELSRTDKREQNILLSQNFNQD